MFKSVTFTQKKKKNHNFFYRVLAGIILCMEIPRRGYIQEFHDVKVNKKKFSKTYGKMVFHRLFSDKVL